MGGGNDTGFSRVEEWTPQGQTGNEALGGQEQTPEEERTRWRIAWRQWMEWNGVRYAWEGVRREREREWSENGKSGYDEYLERSAGLPSGGNISLRR